MGKKSLYHKEDFMLPNGRPDFGKLRLALEAENPSPEEMKEVAEKLAKEHGKSMDDVLVECIRSGELSESETAEAMEMLGQMPLSSCSDSKN